MGVIIETDNNMYRVRSKTCLFSFVLCMTQKVYLTGNHTDQRLILRKPTNE